MSARSRTTGATRTKRTPVDPNRDYAEGYADGLADRMPDESRSSPLGTPFMRRTAYSRGYHAGSKARMFPERAEGGRS